MSGQPCEEHEPEPGTLYERNGTHIAKLSLARMWPVDARCRHCERWITKAHPDIPPGVGGDWALKYPEDAETPAARFRGAHP